MQIRYGDLVECSDPGSRWYRHVGRVVAMNSANVGVRYPDDTDPPATGRWHPKEFVRKVSEAEARQHQGQRIGPQLDLFKSITEFRATSGPAEILYSARLHTYKGNPIRIDLPDVKPAVAIFEFVNDHRDQTARIEPSDIGDADFFAIRLVNFRGPLGMGLGEPIPFGRGHGGRVEMHFWSRSFHTTADFILDVTFFLVRDTDVAG